MSKWKTDAIRMPNAPEIPGKQEAEAREQRLPEAPLELAAARIVRSYRLHQESGIGWQIYEVSVSYGPNVVSSVASVAEKKLSPSANMKEIILRILEDEAMRNASSWRTK